MASIKEKISDSEHLPARTAAAAASFGVEGFVVLTHVLPKQRVAALRAQVDTLFAGKFETGTYPDEWYWRKELSLADVTRHMANAWKADLTVAALALSEELAEAAGRLAGWSGVRLGQDTIWSKPPGAKAVAYHQDSSFMTFLDPPDTITCWVALDDVSPASGSLEYVPGSHRWDLSALPEKFHADPDYRAQVEATARAAKTQLREPVCLEVPAGSISFHDGRTWHGSGSNRTVNEQRRSIGLHFLPEDVRFSNRSGGYIYSRYRRSGDCSLDESFFPILWSKRGYRTPWLETYLQTGMKNW